MTRIYTRLKRRVSIAWAFLRCHIYCLWRFRCELTGYSADKRRMFIAAVNGVMHADTLKVSRIFYLEDNDGKDISKEITINDIVEFNTWIRNHWNITKEDENAKT